MCNLRAGSLGMVLGAYIAKNCGDIVVVNHKQAYGQAPNEKCLHITDTVKMAVPEKAITLDQMADKYDIILLMTQRLQTVQVVTIRSHR